MNLVGNAWLRLYAGGMFTFGAWYGVARAHDREPGTVIVEALALGLLGVLVGGIVDIVVAWRRR